MTIETFDWGDFWASAWTVSWWELGTLIALALLWRGTRAGKKGAETTSVDVRALFFLAVAFLLGLARKLFEDLDVVALLYAALFVGTAFDWRRARARRRREFRAAELEKRKAAAARRRAFFSGSGGTGASDGSGRRRSSRRSGRGESERSRTDRSRRSSGSRSRGDSNSSQQRDARDDK